MNEENLYNTEIDTAGQQENLAQLLVEEKVAESEEEALEIIAAEQEARSKAKDQFTATEHELYMKEGYSRSIYETDPIKLYEYFRDKIVRVNRQAQENVRNSMLETEGPHAKLSGKEYQTAVEAEVKKLRYFPVMLASAPNIEGKVSGTFPGLPTPLLQATSVMDRYLRTNTFPAEKSPEVVRLFNPDIYTPDFEKEYAEEIKRTQPRVIGISNTSEGHHIAINMAKIAKQVAEDSGFETLVLLGGSHEDGSNPEPYFIEEQGEAKGRYGLQPEHKDVIKQGFTPYDPEAKQYVDVVVAGDGQYALQKIMEIIGDHSDQPNAEVLREIAKAAEAFRAAEGSGNIFVSVPGEEDPVKLSLKGTKLDYDTLPYMFHGRIDHDNFFTAFPKEFDEKGDPISFKKTAQVMTALGCPHACEFCQESLQNLYNLSNPRSVENVANELRILKEYGYEALFFDDSTFTRRYKEDREAELKGEPTRLDGLLDALISLKEKGVEFEWGCQTTFIDVRDQALLQKMKDAGCSYIYFGFEELEMMDPTKKTKGLDKETWKRRVEEVLSWSKGAGIRSGISVQLGLRGEEDFSETIDYVADLYERELITKNSIGLNINVTLPGSRQYVDLLRDGEVPPNFNQKLNRHPDFETAHQLASLSLEQSSNIFARAHNKIGDGLIGVKFNPEMMALLKADENDFSKDLYFPWDKWQDYLQGELKALHLNHASLSEPSKAVNEAAKSVFGKELSEDEKGQIVREARQAAAGLINLSDPNCVAFGRNTTEALSYSLWLAGLKKDDHVVLSNAENKSIARTFQLYMDHGNPEGEDGWSTYPTWYHERRNLPDRAGTRASNYGETIKKSTGIDTTVFDVLNSTDQEIFNNIEASITDKTKAFVVSHVLRDNGREMPIHEIIERVRKIKAEKNPDDPEIFIIVDGAQALGNLPKVDFEELGCDAYVATPHKTMYSTPLGLLYFNANRPGAKEKLTHMSESYAEDEDVILRDPENPRQGIKSVVLKNAFASELGITANVDDEIEIADINGFRTATQELEKHGYKTGDFSEIAGKRRQLKGRFMQEIDGLALKHGAIIREPQQGTDFIYSFNVAGISNHRFVELLHENNVFVSYIDRSRIADDGTIRVSFGVENSEEQIRDWVKSIDSALGTAIDEKARETENVIDGRLIFNDQPTTSGLFGWLRDKMRSPLGRVATAATGAAAAFGAATWMLSRNSQLLQSSPELSKQARVEIAQLNREIDTTKSMLAESFTPGGDSYLSTLQSNEAKYTILLNSRNRDELNRTLSDEATVGLAGTANYTEREKQAIQNLYDQTDDQRLGGILSTIETRDRIETEEATV